MLHTKGMCCALAAWTLAALCLPGAAQEPTTQNGAHLKFTLAPQDDAKPVTVSVTGKITDAAGGKPIEGAIVRGYIVVWRYTGPDMFDRCPLQETKTDANGKYKLTFNTLLTTSGLMKGKDGAGVWVSAPNYETRPIHVKPEVTARKTEFTDVDVALNPGKLLQGKIVDEDDKPLDGAVVDLQNNWNGSWVYFGCLGRTTTDRNGSFQLWCSTDPNVVGKPWLVVRKPGYGQIRFWDILSAEHLDELKVMKGGTISGRVADTKGNPVVGYEVSARCWPLVAFGRTITDEKGQYQLPGIPGYASQEEFIKSFNKTTNRNDEPAKVTVYARPSADIPLKAALHYEIQAQDGQTIVGPDLVVGADTAVSGKLLPSKTALSLKGMPVRLDYDWDTMVEADADGNFRFDSVSPGKHRLTAYLPTNLRGDAGIGQAEVTVESGKSIRDVQIQLQALAEVRMQILDAKGNPLEGVTAGATLDRTGDGFWTEGTVSDEDGQAVLYLYPDQVQYIRGFDTSNKLVAEACERVKPSAGAVIENVRINMVCPASIRGKLTAEDKSAVSDGKFLCRLDYADGMQLSRGVKTDASGQLELKDLQPGVVKLTVETEPPGLAGTTTAAVEIKPGQSREIEVALAKVKLCTVSGKLVPSPTFQKLQGFKIRLDLKDWKPMVETGADGEFTIASVPAGTHRLTVYLPFNLRTDRGVGHTQVEVDGDMKDVKLPLETLATVNMKIVDESGAPLEGVFAAAWWTEDHSGVFTEGTKSDKDGNATLYVYPDEKQYLGAADWKRKWRVRQHKEVTLKPGEVLNGPVMVMAKE